MPELRWTLLIIGVVFIAVLAWWERRRPHQASRESLGESGETRSGSNPDSVWGTESERSGGPRALREPTLTLPEIRVRAPGTTPQDLPVVEIAGDDSLAGLDIDGERVDERITAIDDEVEQVEIAHPRGDAVPEEFIPEPAPARAQEPKGFQPREPIATRTREPTPASVPAPFPARTHEPTPASIPVAFPARTHEPMPASIPVAFPARTHEPASLQSTDSAAQRAIEPAAQRAAEPAAQRAAERAPDERAVGPAPELAPAATALEPIVDWPPEDVRRLIALRLVAPQHERFAGRAVRQALAAEGFVLGKFSIFHKPDAQNRAVLSVASLTKPGTFDLETMDTQRFGGLNMFAVLPGPKPPLKAFDELLAAARGLNERLEGALQDERGGPLTPTRVASLRDALGAETRP